LDALKKRLSQKLLVNKLLSYSRFIKSFKVAIYEFEIT
jgi:hypothetical protein